MKSIPSSSPRFVGAAVLLPCIGLFLLMPPVISLFAVERDIGGVPMIVIYLFGIWMGLVVCAGLLARGLVHRAPPAAIEAETRGEAGIDRKA